MDIEAVPSLHSLVEQDIDQHEDKLAVLYDTGKLKEYVTYGQIWKISSEVRCNANQMKVHCKNSNYRDM